MYYFVDITPDIRIGIDNLNVTILKKREKRDNEEVSDDDGIEKDSPYSVVGYYASRDLDVMTKVLLNITLIKNREKTVATLNEFQNSFDKSVSKLIKALKAPMEILTNKCKEEIDEISEIDNLKKELKLLKASITRDKTKSDKLKKWAEDGEG